MKRSRMAIAKIRGQIRVIASIFVCSLLLAAGCKTSEDAASAATQMSTTAKSLSDYYTALNTILANTDQLYMLNEQILAKPYTAENEAELAKRAALAAEFSTFAGEFAKLAGSTASADVAASANKLETEVDTLASVKASTGEQNALKTALQIFVTAIQEHKEREAARAMDDIAKGLTALFIKEGEVWNSVETNYTRTAAVLAGYLVDHDATDQSALLKVALDPFGLMPSVVAPELRAALAPLAKQQIATRTAALDASYVTATDNMTKSLQEMSKRIDAVADDRPMAFRMPPATVANVEKWTTQVASY